MSKKLVVLFSSLVLFLTVTTFAVSQSEKDKGKDKEKKKGGDLYSQIELFSYALTTVQSEYVDEKEPQEIIYGALKGMLSELDPHSQFLEPTDYEDLKTETQGKFGGLGIEISVRDGLLTIVTPIEDTPAWRVGLKSGDKIVKIGDEITRDMTLSEAVKLLRGDPGTDVTITILREDEFKIHEFTITREVIHIVDVKDVHLVDEKIGYIRLTEFREDSAKSFHKGLEDLRAQGADSIIVDMRNNPGGLLNVAIQITEEFLPYGELIVSTKGRHSSQNTETRSKNKDKDFAEWPMVVLINEGSASGSEIFAGALKDQNRAIILGEKSFGKGSVQSVIPLPDGSGIRLTTSKYYTPSGVSIHGVGIEPDVKVKRIFPKEDEDEDTKAIKEKVKNVEKIFEDVKSKDKDPELTEKEKKEAELKEKMASDNQIQSAISVIKGIKVYRNVHKKEQPVEADPS